MSEVIGDIMTNEEKRVLEVCSKPSTRIKIAEATGLSLGDVSKVIRKLEKKGLIISRGYTTARKHMTLAAAINELFTEVHRLASKITTAP